MKLARKRAILSMLGITRKAFGKYIAPAVVWSGQGWTQKDDFALLNRERLFDVCKYLFIVSIFFTC